MTIYRVIYNRTAESHLDIPVEDVKSIETYDGTLRVVNQQDQSIIILRLSDLVAVGLFTAPDPQPVEPVE